MIQCAQDAILMSSFGKETNIMKIIQALKNPTAIVMDLIPIMVIDALNMLDSKKKTPPAITARGAFVLRGG